MEYVILIAVGVLFASLLYAALSSDSIQQALKDRVIQALTGELTAVDPADDSPDRDHDHSDQPATPPEAESPEAASPASSPPAPGEGDPGFLEGLWNFGGKLLDDTTQWFVDIYEKDIKGAWNNPLGYFQEVVGWEDIKHSWQKLWDDPLQYLKDSWDNTVEGWNEFWANPIENGAKLIFDWEQFAESWRGKDDNGRQIPLPNRIWGVVESLPTPAKAIKIVSAADGIFIHDACAKKKGNSGCGGKKTDPDRDSNTKINEILGKKHLDDDELTNELINHVNEEHLDKLYQSLRERYPEEKAKAIARNLSLGVAFNKKMQAKYPYNEVYVEYSKKDGTETKVRLDSYVPGEEIISRKYTQLAAVKPETAKKYIDELVGKYPPNAKIADVPTQKKGSGHSNDGLAGDVLEGDMILEVPVQKKDVPKEILDYATKKDVIIRDETGRVLNPEAL